MAGCFDQSSESNGKHDRFLDAGLEPRRMLQPIEGFQNLPLVSLEKSVEPLVTHCPDIRRRVYIAMSNCESPPDGLDQDESASVYLYTMEWEPRDECLYYALNKTLRTENRQELKPWFSYLKLVLTALRKLPSQKATIWRGVTLDLNQEYQIGKRYVWWAFSSCTQSVAVLESDYFLGTVGPRTLFNIECENGKMIRSHSYVAVEDEILLLPATQFEVKSKLNPSPNLCIIHLKQVEPPFPLIESTPVTPTSKVQTTYRNEKLEKEIAQHAVNGTIDLSRQQLIDSDIAIVVQQAIIDKKCSTLKINHNNIADQGAQRLGQVLQSNIFVTELDLRNNQISDVGIRWIAQSLHTNSTLTMLFLHKNLITSEGAQFLAQALQVNSILRRLGLFGNKDIDDDAARYFAQALVKNTTLIQLDLDQNKITDAGIVHLAKMLQQNSTLKDLDISKNPVTDEGIKILMDALCDNRGLRILEMRCPQITDKSFEYIQKMLKRNQTLQTILLLGDAFSVEKQEKLQAVAKTNGCKISFE